MEITKCKWCGKKVFWEFWDGIETLGEFTKEDEAGLHTCEIDWSINPLNDANCVEKEQ